VKTELDKLSVSVSEQEQVNMSTCTVFQCDSGLHAFRKLPQQAVPHAYLVHVRSLYKGLQNNFIQNCDCPSLLQLDLYGLHQA